MGNKRPLHAFRNLPKAIYRFTLITIIVSICVSVSLIIIMALFQKLNWYVITGTLVTDICLWISIMRNTLRYESNR
jgi:hypothetical protein